MPELKFNIQVGHIFEIAKRVMTREILFSIGLLFTVAFCFAQEFRKPFLRITADDGLGLSSNKIYSLLEDSSGYLWIGTSNGIQRFDGAKFIFFDTEKPGSEKLPEEEISKMVGLPSGKICILF